METEASAIARGAPSSSSTEKPRISGRPPWSDEAAAVELVGRRRADELEEDVFQRRSGAFERYKPDAGIDDERHDRGTRRSGVADLDADEAADLARDVARPRSVAEPCDQPLQRLGLTRLGCQPEHRPSVTSEEVVEQPLGHEPAPIENGDAVQTRSTSASTWVDNTTVVWPRSAGDQLEKVTRPSGSSELTGSSRKTIAGWWIRACAMPSRWRIPPDHPAIRRSAAARRPVASSMSATRAWSAWPSSPPSRPASSRSSRPRIHG